MAVFIAAITRRDGRDKCFPGCLKIIAANIVCKLDIARKALVTECSENPT